MKRFIFLQAFTAVAIALCGMPSQKIQVKNNLPFSRSEMAAVSANDLPETGSFVILDSDGNEVPYQKTFDGLIIFPVKADALSSSFYFIEEGTPAPVDTLATGKLYAWRKDDFTWENEHCAYRAYGPELQRSGERAFGYDIWTKSVDRPVVEERYKLAEKGIWFHSDHGNGLDVYSVGPTLGGGAAALLDPDGQPILPWAFKEVEVLDNGPLRFSFRLTYNPLTVGAQSDVIETRFITLDAGSPLNHTAITYSGLSEPTDFAPGLVVHRQNTEGICFDSKNHIMAYADLTDNPTAGNGTIYLGIIYPESEELSFKPLPQPAGDALGHILAKGVYTPGSRAEYWWGADWSKSGMESMEQWHKTLAQFAQSLQSPLEITLK